MLVLITVPYDSDLIVIVSSWNIFLISRNDDKIPKVLIANCMLSFS